MSKRKFRDHDLPYRTETLDATTADCVQMNATPGQFHHSNVAHLNETGNTNRQATDELFDQLRSICHSIRYHIPEIEMESNIVSTTAGRECQSALSQCVGNGRTASKWSLDHPLTAFSKRFVLLDAPTAPDKISFMCHEHSEFLYHLEWRRCAQRLSLSCSFFWNPSDSAADGRTCFEMYLATGKSSGAIYEFVPQNMNQFRMDCRIPADLETTSIIRFLLSYFARAEQCDRDYEDMPLSQVPLFVPTDRWIQLRRFFLNQSADTNNTAACVQVNATSSKFVARLDDKNVNTLLDWPWPLFCVLLEYDGEPPVKGDACFYQIDEQTLECRAQLDRSEE
jgi:hypothetical protein